MKRKVVFIMGTAYSGSTLLDLLLGSHPSCFSLGELSQLHRYHNLGSLRQLLNLYKDKVHPGICTVCDEYCPFWNEKVNVDLLAASLVRSNTGRVGSLLRELLRYFVNPYSYLFSKLGQHILVDSSKSVNWISNQLSLKEFKTKSIESYLLYIVRDGRAVLNSTLRKYPNRSVAEVSQQWINIVIQMNEFYDGFAPSKKTRVRYEKLATSTVTTLQSVCRLLEIEFIPSMIKYWEHEHHPIVANIGTRSLIWRARGLQGKELDKIRQRHGKYYDELGLNIRLDLRWKDELSLDKVDEFERVAGHVNASFKYEARDNAAERGKASHLDSIERRGCV